MPATTTTPTTSSLLNPHASTNLGHSAIRSTADTDALWSRHWAETQPTDSMRWFKPVDATAHKPVFQTAGCRMAASRS